MQLSTYSVALGNAAALDTFSYAWRCRYSISLAIKKGGCSPQLYETMTVWVSPHYKLYLGLQGDVAALFILS